MTAASVKAARPVMNQPEITVQYAGHAVNRAFLPHALSAREEPMATMNVTYVVERGAACPWPTRSAGKPPSGSPWRGSGQRPRGLWGFSGCGAASHWWFVRTSMRAGISFFTPRPSAMALRTDGAGGGNGAETFNASFTLPGKTPRRWRSPSSPSWRTTAQK